MVQAVKGEYEESIKWFDRAISIYPYSIQSYYNSAVSCHGNMRLCHAQLGQKAEALAELARALEIDPRYQPALSNQKLVEQMEEGRPLENTEFKSVNHAMENFLQKRK